MEKNKDGSQKVWLKPREYRKLKHNPLSKENKLIIQLGGECGLRAFETTQIKPKHLHGNFLTIPAGKDTSGEYGGKKRDTYLSDELKSELILFHDKAPNKQFFDYSPRSIKRKVKKAAKNTAKKTQNQNYRYVSSHDLRRYFAHNLLVRERINPEVVMELGGWSDYQSIKPYLNKPTEENIKKEMEKVVE